MKVIDAKGRIFGKLNIIDLLVIIAVIAVGVILASKVIGGSDGLGGSTKLSYTVKVKGVEKEVFENLQSMTFPDQLMAAGNLVNGKVLSVTGEKSQTQVLQVKPDDNGTPTDVTLYDPDLYDVVFTLEAFVANEVKSELGTQEIRVGKSHIVKTQNIEFENGIITSCTREKAS